MYVHYIKDTEFLKALGKRIKAIRLEKHLTQEDLGFLCNNHGEQIGRIERGEHNVTICSLLNISKALKVPLKELLDFEY
ncbi:MAG: hypothetical protein Kow0079_03480 [Vicingaceae bacterium]